MSRFVFGLLTHGKNQKKSNENKRIIKMKLFYSVGLLGSFIIADGRIRLEHGYDS